jgi:hypothetical protein
VTYHLSIDQKFYIELNKNESEIKVQNHLVKNVPGNASDKLIDNDEEPMELSNVAIKQVENISGMEVHSFKNLFELALKIY